MTCSKQADTILALRERALKALKSYPPVSVCVHGREHPCACVYRTGHAHGGDEVKAQTLRSGGKNLHANLPEKHLTSEHRE